MTETYYKVLDKRRSMHGGYGEWRKGRWRSVRGTLIPCENGLHVCALTQLIHWLGPEIWVCEVDGEILGAEDKTIVRRARITERTLWDERVARLFAADCAERALLREREAGREPDPRSWEAIQVARRYAVGDASRAAWAAARAARAAAGAAARDAAWDAAWAAAGDVAWAAAGDAARAARAAAWDAAWDAAGAAARDAGWAAGAAAWDAERAWQCERLGAYLNGTTQ